MTAPAKARAVRLFPATAIADRLRDATHNVRPIAPSRKAGVPFPRFRPLRKLALYRIVTPKNFSLDNTLYEWQDRWFKREEDEAGRTDEAGQPKDLPRPPSEPSSDGFDTPMPAEQSDIEYASESASAYIPESALSPSPSAEPVRDPRSAQPQPESPTSKSPQAATGQSAGNAKKKPPSLITLQSLREGHIGPALSGVLSKKFRKLGTKSRMNSKFEAWWWENLPKVYDRTSPTTIEIKTGNDIQISSNASKQAFLICFIRAESQNDQTRVRPETILLRPVDDIKHVWNNLPKDWNRKKQFNWMEIMLTLLRYQRPHAALRFMLATQYDSHPENAYPSEPVLSSALDACTALLLANKPKYMKVVDDNIAHLYNSLLHLLPTARRNRFIQHFLATQLPKKYLETFYERFAKIEAEKVGHHLSGRELHTQAHWAYSFVQARQEEKALSVLYSVGKENLERLTDFPIVAQVYSDVVAAALRTYPLPPTSPQETADPEAEEGIGHDSQVEVAFFNAIKPICSAGMLDQIEWYNSIISNAFDSDRPASAISLFNYIDDHEYLAPDRFTVLAMLRGLDIGLLAKARDGNCSITETDFHRAQNRVYQLAVRLLRNKRDELVAVEIAYSHWQHHYHQTLPTGDQSPFWPFYLKIDQIFDISPLVALGLPPIPEKSRLEPLFNERLPARKEIAHLVLHSYISDPARISGDFLIPLYQRFHDMLAQGTLPDIWLSIYVFNSFLRAFGRFSSTTDLVSEILEDLSIASSKSATATDLQPNQHTCNILLNIFVKSKQEQAAQKVEALMQSRGISASPMTWNILISALSKAGRYSDAAVTLKSLASQTTLNELSGLNSEPELNDPAADYRDEAVPEADIEDEPPLGFSILRDSRPSFERPIRKRPHELARLKPQVFPETIITLDKLKSKSSVDIVAQVLKEIDKESERVWRPKDADN